MHEIKLPSTWPYKMLFAVLIVTFCKGLHHVTKYELEWERIVFIRYLSILH